MSASQAPPIRIAELLVFDGSVANSPCPRRVLVDGGASCSFVDASFARTLDCEYWQLPTPLVIKTANGGKVVCSHVIAAADICIEGHRGRHDLVVMPDLDEFDVVLGRTFLQASKAIIHHEHGTINWPNCPNSTVDAVLARAAPLSANPWHVLSPDDDADGLDSDSAALPIETSAAEAANTFTSRVTQKCRRRRHTRSSSKLNVVSQSHAVSTHPKPAKQNTDHSPALSYSLPLAKMSSVSARSAIIDSQPTGSAGRPASQPASPAPCSPAVLETLERVLKRVAEYEDRMKPQEGKLPPSRGQFDHKIELKDPDAAPFKGRAIPLNTEERAQLALDIRELQAEQKVRLTRREVGLL